MHAPPVPLAPDRKPTWGERFPRVVGALRTSYAVERAWTLYGRKRGWVAADNFLVLGAVRSGTTLLVDYLSCHSRIRCHGEILGERAFYYGDPKRMSRRRLRLHIEAHFVKRPRIVAGAKVLTYHFDELPIRMADLVRFLHRPKVIVLYRQQVLEQYVSLKMAERTGVWHAGRRPASGPIDLDVDDFLAYAERERRMWRESLAGLADVPVFGLPYERLAAEPAAVMSEVFDFLGVEGIPIRSWLTKLNPQPLASKVANHSDFLAAGVVEQSRLEIAFPQAT